MNELIVAGYIGQDANPKFTPTGTPVTEFSVAVKVGYGKNEKTQWFNCSLWGRDGNHHGLTAYLKKGTFVVVSGELTVSAYAGKNGPTGSADVRVMNVTLGGAKEAGGDSGGSQGYPEAQKPQTQPESDVSDDSNIPF